MGVRSFNLVLVLTCALAAAACSNCPSVPSVVRRITSASAMAASEPLAQQQHARASAPSLPPPQRPWCKEERELPG